MISRFRSLPLPLILFFDAVEGETLLKHLPGHSEERVDGSRFVLGRGNLDGRPVCFARLPFGDKVEDLQRSLQALINASSPGFLVVFGTAMGLHPQVTPGEILLPLSARCEDRECRLGEALLPQVMRSLPHGLHIRTGSTLTVRTFVDGADAASQLHQQWPNQDILEMEDFWIALAAEESRIPAISFRYVTDRGSFNEHMARLSEASACTVRLVRRFLRQQCLERMLATIDNPTTCELPFNLVVRSTLGPLSIPQGVAIARRAANRFKLRTLLPVGSRLDLILTTDPGDRSLWRTPAGKARVAEIQPLWSFLIDETAGYARLMLAPEMLEEPRGSEPSLLPLLNRAPEKDLPAFDDSLPYHAPPNLDGVHIQGLNSISAEAEEGLLAACMVEEFREQGYPVVPAGDSSLWIYRSAHAATDSYFTPPYVVPARSGSWIPPNTTLVVTGLGPAIDPGAPGGDLAHTLMLGDEFGGRLIQYLDDLAGGSFTASDVFRYEGVIQVLDDRTIVLSRIDRRPLLTPEGLNELRFEPATLRRIYSGEYDRFLADYFFDSRRRDHPPRGSYLLLTSRGCGTGCSICCSGAYQPFTSLSPETIVSMLRAIRDKHQLRPGEYFDIYFLDSYFNRNPRRVITLAERLESEGLIGSFEFYVRHNGLLAFLQDPTRTRREGHDDSPNEPAIDHELIGAYRRLGIDEIVLGIDAFTDLSIRLLKTDVHRLAREGPLARPTYTFAEIAAVLASIEAAGLKSRCFLLLNNPFVDDADRLRTFYHLLMLSIDLPGFQIDYTSSDRVNELKPFPGAPLTQVAERVSGLIHGDRFEFSTPIGRIEEVLSFDLFGERRPGRAARRRFLSAAQTIRARLGEFLAERFDRLPPGQSDGRKALCSAIHEFLQGEELIRARFAATAREFPDALPREKRIELQFRQLETRLNREPPIDGDSVPEPARQFCQILRTVTRRSTPEDTP